jgi:hypothetical protein
VRERGHVKRRLRREEAGQLPSRQVMHQPAGDDHGAGAVVNRDAGVEGVPAHEPAVQRLALTQLDGRADQCRVHVDARQLDSRAQR